MTTLPDDALLRITYHDALVSLAHTAGTLLRDEAQPNQAIQEAAETVNKLTVKHKHLLETLTVEGRFLDGRLITEFFAQKRDPYDPPDAIRQLIEYVTLQPRTTLYGQLERYPFLLAAAELVGLHSVAIGLMEQPATVSIDEHDLYANYVDACSLLAELSNNPDLPDSRKGKIEQTLHTLAAHYPFIVEPSGRGGLRIRPKHLKDADT